MNTKLIAAELRETIEDDCFDCLEDKLEALQLLADFETASGMRGCSLCYRGRILDECTGSDMGRCEQCKGVGFVPLG